MYETIARYYDQLHESLTADIQLLLQLAGETGGPLLELGSGTGRLLIPLAQAGYQVTGIDNSPQMLAIAHEKLANQPPSVQQAATIVNSDLRELSTQNIDGRFALAILPYNTLLHFSGTELARLLRGIAALLQPQGRLFIDIANPFVVEQAPPAAEPVFETSFFDTSTAQRVEQWSTSSLDEGAQTLTVAWSFQTPDADSEPQTVETSYHYLFPHQLELLLQQAGLKLEKIMGGYAESPFQENSERLLILARLED